MNTFQQFIIVLTLSVVLSAVEALQPVERHQPLRERLRNIGILAVLLFVGGYATSLIARFFPFHLLPPAEHRGVAFTVFCAFLALFVWDLLFYWYHRAEHAWPWLWHIHKLHHSDRHLNATSSFRHAWIEGPIESFFLSLPVILLLRLDATGAFLFSVFATVWLLFVHMNWKLHLGPLTPLLCGPQMHRIHHSVEQKHRDKNFAVYFPFIDRLFGTYYSPAPDEFPPTGTEDLATNVPLPKAAAIPFLDWLGANENVKRHHP